MTGNPTGHPTFEMQEVTALFDLNDLSTANSGELCGKDPWTILTPAEQWSYAAILPVRREALESVAPGEPLLVRVEAQVEKGEIAIGLVEENLQTYLLEQERSFLQPETPFDLVLESCDKVKWLVVRSAAPSGLRSKVRLRTIRTFRLPKPGRASPPKDIPGDQLADDSLFKISERWGVPPDDDTDWASIPFLSPLVADQKPLLDLYIPRDAVLDRVLSLCCGHGHAERELRSARSYRHCDALDISEPALQNARRLAHEQGIDNISYQNHDINHLQLSHYYDLAIAGGIHHISNLEHVFAEVARWLRPGAPLIMYEYIGPNQYQPTRRQLEAIKACIHLIPEKYRIHASAQRKLGLQSLDQAMDHFRKHRTTSDSELISSDPAVSRFFRAEHIPMSRAQWDITDPSEAVRSEDIIPVAKQVFGEVVVRYLPGSIVQFTLYDLAANFYSDTEEVHELLEMLVKIEDVLMKFDKDIPQNYAMIAARNPP